jgi:hypothetical protein
LSPVAVAVELALVPVVVLGEWSRAVEFLLHHLSFGLRLAKVAAVEFTSQQGQLSFIPPKGSLPKSPKIQVDKL